MNVKKIGQKRTATIVNVAEMAEVSIGTVSRHLNGFEIKERNRLRIEEAIKALSYSRNAFASAMKSRSSNMVGLLVPDYDEFHAQLLGGLVTTLRKEGIVTLTYCHESSAEGRRDAIEYFRAHRVGALIMNAVKADDDGIKAMMNDGVRVITYDNDAEDEGIDRVMVDNRDASRKAVAHLLDQGHRRIAIVTGDMENWTAGERLAGYTEAYEAIGETPPDDLIYYGSWRHENGKAAMAQFSKMDCQPTAVFGSNHQMSMGMLAYARENAISIPDDISLVSFDDIEMFQYLTPAITAVAQPVGQIVEAIKRLLLRRLTTALGARAEVELLRCEFRPRSSVAPLKPG